MNLVEVLAVAGGVTAATAAGLPAWTFARACLADTQTAERSLREPRTTDEPPTATARLNLPACHGRLTLHVDGHTTCDGGQADCWPGIGRPYTHTPAVSCHGCAECLTLEARHG